MQVHINGAFFISADRETRFAGACNLPSTWLEPQKQASGDIHTLTHAPIFVAYSDGTEEVLSWYNPHAASPRLHPQDYVEVMVLREKSEAGFADLLKLLRFCEFSIRETQAIGSKDTRVRVLKSLHDDLQLRELVGEHVLRTNEKSVLKPRFLRALFEYEITPKTLQMELRHLVEHVTDLMQEGTSALDCEIDHSKSIEQMKETTPLHDKPNEPALPSVDFHDEMNRASLVYDRVRAVIPGLPTFDEAISDLQKRKNQIDRDQVINFINGLINHESDDDEQIAATAPKVAKFLNAKSS